MSMNRTASQPPAVSPAEFRDAIGRLASGVTVITAVSNDRRFGATASAVSSLSLEPPMLLVCMNRQSATGAAILRARAFAVNVLAEDQDYLARRFASRDPDKFHGISVTEGSYGEPLLDGALAQFECRVTEQVRGGTHTVFVSKVDRALAHEGKPLAYFRGRFGRLHVTEDKQPYIALETDFIYCSIGDWTVP
jgi:4-nitrophenol 2-monooxygenase / 4-nitrocatechol 4-monooxygenase, reductase component